MLQNWSQTVSSSLFSHTSGFAFSTKPLQIKVTYKIWWPCWHLVWNAEQEWHEKITMSCRQLAVHRAPETQAICRSESKKRLQHGLARYLTKCASDAWNDFTVKTQPYLCTKAMPTIPPYPKCIATCLCDIHVYSIFLTRSMAHVFAQTLQILVRITYATTINTFRKLDMCEVGV